MPRFLDWLFYAALIGGIVAISIMDQEANAPPAPEVAGEDELGAFLGPSTPFDPAVVVQQPDRPSQPTTGTAFAIDGDGLWLTARHVVEGCRDTALIVGGGQAVAADVRISPRSDVALLSTQGGPNALPIAPASERLRIGRRAYHPGFPQGRPGEVATRLLGRETMQLRGRGHRDEPVLAWAEIGRTEGLRGTLAGLSGGPALDHQGRIIAVTIAEAPRRGRVYTTAVESLTEVTDALELGDEYAPGAPVNVRNYGTVSDTLRRDLRVAQVVCLSGQAAR